MKEVRRILIDKSNQVVLSVWQFATEYGFRYNYSLEVCDTDPFVDMSISSDGHCTMTAAEREGRKMYRSFRSGDELCLGVFKI